MLLAQSGLVIREFLTAFYGRSSSSAHGRVQCAADFDAIHLPNSRGTGSSPSQVSTLPSRGGRRHRFLKAEQPVEAPQKHINNQQHQACHLTNVSLCYGKKYFDDDYGYTNATAIVLCTPDFLESRPNPGAIGDAYDITLNSTFSSDYGLGGKSTVKAFIEGEMQQSSEYAYSFFESTNLSMTQLSLASYLERYCGGLPVCDLRRTPREGPEFGTQKTGCGVFSYSSFGIL